MWFGDLDQGNHHGEFCDVACIHSHKGQKPRSKLICLNITRAHHCGNTTMLTQYACHAMTAPENLRWCSSTLTFGDFFSLVGVFFEASGDFFIIGDLCTKHHIQKTLWAGKGCLQCLPMCQGEDCDGEPRKLYGELVLRLSSGWTGMITSSPVSQGGGRSTGGSLDDLTCL